MEVTWSRKGAILEDWAQPGQEGAADRDLTSPWEVLGALQRGESPRIPYPCHHVTLGGQLWLEEGQMVVQGHRKWEGAGATERRDSKNFQLTRVTKNPHCHRSSVTIPNPHTIQIMLWTSPQVSLCPSGWKLRKRLVGPSEMSLQFQKERKNQLQKNI